VDSGKFDLVQLGAIRGKTRDRAGLAGLPDRFEQTPIREPVVIVG
jgi:hypothetical protein